MTQVKSPTNTMVLEPIATEGTYNLYKVDGYYEVWCGIYTTDKNSDLGVRVGYVWKPENFGEAIDRANEELAYMMAEAGL